LCAKTGGKVPNTAPFPPYNEIDVLYALQVRAKKYRIWWTMMDDDDGLRFGLRQESSTPIVAAIVNRKYGENHPENGEVRRFVRKPLIDRILGGQEPRAFDRTRSKEWREI